jgi:hypothetical protein
MKPIDHIVADRDDKEMMLRPDAWPSLFLPIKHKDHWSMIDKGPSEGLGVIVPASNDAEQKELYDAGMVLVLFNCSMFELGSKTKADLKKMPVRNLIAAGWVVD